MTASPPFHPPARDPAAVRSAAAILPAPLSLGRQAPRQPSPAARCPQRRSACASSHAPSAPRRLTRLAHPRPGSARHSPASGGRRPARRSRRRGGAARSPLLGSAHRARQGPLGSRRTQRTARRPRPARPLAPPPTAPRCTAEDRRPPRTEAAAARRGTPGGRPPRYWNFGIVAAGL